MVKRTTKSANYAVCVDNSAHPVSLELHKIYQLIPDKAAGARGLVRVIDESGEDYLYPAACFVDINLPAEAERSFQSASA